MRPVRQLGLILAVLCLLAPGCGSTTAAVADHGTKPKSTPSPTPVAHQVHPCTAFGKSWMHKYNMAGGPVKIVSVCCALRSPQTGNSACKMMVTVRHGPGEGTFGCGVATVAKNGDILANRPQACARSAGSVALPA
jgi:hypothetical protein